MKNVLVTDLDGDGENGLMLEEKNKDMIGERFMAK